jgi:UDP-N-acetylglucosamine 2-epimerase (non-hydrolysing)
MLDQVLTTFGIHVDISLNLMAPNQSLALISSEVLTAVDKVIDTVQPHLILVQGDTTTAYMSALAAFYRDVPVGHVEAGLRTYNIHSPFPEEMNRVGISTVASLHFAPTNLAASNLMKEATRRKHVYVTGNTGVDALHMFFNSPKSEVFYALLDIRDKLVPSGDPILVLLTAHRRENHGQPLTNILRAGLSLISQNPNLVIFLPVHMSPQVRANLRAVLPDPDPIDVYGAPLCGAAARLRGRLVLLQPLAYRDLVHLMAASDLVITDSGGMQEEAASLGRPVLILRNSTERVEGIEAGSALIVGTDEGCITATAARLIRDPAARAAMGRPLPLYGDGSAAARIADIIARNTAALRGRTLA